MLRVEIEQPRKVVPIRVEYHLPCRYVRAHPGGALRVVVPRLAAGDVAGRLVDIDQKNDGQSGSRDRNLNCAPGLGVLFFFCDVSRFLSIEKWLQVMENCES